MQCATSAAVVVGWNESRTQPGFSEKSPASMRSVMCFERVGSTFSR